MIQKCAASIFEKSGTVHVERPQVRAQYTNFGTSNPINTGVSAKLADRLGDFTIETVSE